MNVVVLTGNMADDAELRSTSGGRSVTSFNLAVDRQAKDEKADFITIVAWERTAEFVSKYLSKGRRIAVTGQLRTRSYEDQNGSRHKVVEVYADRIEFADSRPMDPLA